MNLPNKLTMMRVVLVPVFMIFAAVSHYGTADFHAAYMLIAGVIFAIASITDFLDGYLARKNHLVTDFGKFMDPLADKCLTTAAFIYMVTDHVCSPIVLAVILSIGLFFVIPELFARLLKVWMPGSSSNWLINLLSGILRILILIG